MSKWILYGLAGAAVMLGIILTAMYVRTAQRLYARDKEHSASGGTRDHDDYSPSAPGRPGE
jgi:hypothetical protein